MRRSCQHIIGINILSGPGILPGDFSFKKSAQFTTVQRKHCEKDFPSDFICLNKIIWLQGSDALLKQRREIIGGGLLQVRSEYKYFAIDTFNLISRFRLVEQFNHGS